MPELDHRLRALGEASATVHRSPDAEAWEAVRERLDGVGAPIVTLSPAAQRREPRRNRFVAAAAVGVAAALVGAVLMVSRRGDGGGGLAVATADGALPRLLLDPVPDGYRLGTAYDDLPVDMGGQYVILLRSTASPIVDVNVSVTPGGNPSVEGADVTPVTVQGRGGFLQSGSGSNSNVVFGDGVVTMQVLVSGVGTSDGAIALDVAGRLVRNGPNPADVSLATVPDGFTVRFSGPVERIVPVGGYQVEYAAAGGGTAVLRVARAPMPTAELAALGGYDRVTVLGRPAYVGAGSPGGPAPVDQSSTTLLVDLGDVVVAVSADGLTRQQVLDLAANLRVLDDATWRSRLGASLQSVGSGAAATTVPPTTPPLATTAPLTPTTALDPASRLTELYVSRPDLAAAEPCACNWRMEPAPVDQQPTAGPPPVASAEGVVAVKFGLFSGFGAANAPVTRVPAWIVIRTETVTPSCAASTPPSAADAPTTAPVCGPVEGWTVDVVADDGAATPLANETTGGLPAPTLR